MTMITVMVMGAAEAIINIEPTVLDQVLNLMRGKTYAVTSCH